ncbi:MAG: hypothetical protein LBQ10_07275 [Desulfovibrio sp.]|jgi:hypothetical protein|nr:hypothetical protein [Desulfovibrio sp.]
MNKTNFHHAAIAAIIQAIVTALLLLAGPVCLTSVLAGALPGCFLFYGREHAQKERLLLKIMPQEEAWKGAVNLFLWDVDSRLDFFMPVAGAVIQAAVWGVLVWLLNA